MRRILCNIPHRPTTIVCTAVGGGRATISAAVPTAGDVGGGGHGFLPNLEKPKPHAFVKVEAEEAKFTDIFGVFVGQSSCFVTARKQLKNEERARKAVGILFRDYGGRATRDDAAADDKVAKTKNSCKITEEEFDAFVNNLKIECETDLEKYKFVRKAFQKVIGKMSQDDREDELGDSTRVDKLAEIAEEELDAILTNSFTTNLMIECEPKYEKHFRKVIEKVRKKMIQDDRIMKASVFLTNLMIESEAEYEKLLRDILEKVCEKITQDDKVGNENIPKIKILAKLNEKAQLAIKVGNERKISGFEEELDAFVTKVFLTNLMMVEKMKPYFEAFEVVEKVAKKMGNENVRKIAEEKLDAFITNSFVTKIVEVEMMKPFFMYLKTQ